MDDAQSVLLPHAGQHTLADLTPSLLTAAGVPGLANRLSAPPARTVCLLLIDGLGWRLLREHADMAPFLTEALGDNAPLTAGFPSTTSTSLASIGTGLPSGGHGIVGFTFEVPGQPLLNTLLWTTQLGARQDLREQLVPEDVQPAGTLFERAKTAGLQVSMAAPRHHRGSGLTRAVLRGAKFLTCHALGDLVTTASDALNADGRAFCYAYHGDLDTIGHVYGPGSPPWRQQLGFIDRVAAAIAAAVPRDGLLAITADHGMVTMTDRLDVKDHPDLTKGVRVLGGEPRMRHVYAEPGAADEVLARWRSVLGERAMVRGRDEAIAAGWFGPSVADPIRERIGDVVAPMLGDTGVVQTAQGTNEARMIGQHGSLTAMEQQVPLIMIRN
ncbi:MAG TPA: alkaline phosphatase family protein [Pseudonocardiaceae bacterium]|nr:alkaline phosphatase family protein [Pseudonocardiaceae bacterium]